MNESLRILCDDARGKIISVAERADVIKITSKLGARRANHYHKEFGHWCLVVYGCIEYWERKVGSTDHPKAVRYYTGDLFWTGPMVEHLMLFPYDALTQFYCFSVGARDRESYETDTVRLDFKLEDARCMRDDQLTRGELTRIEEAAQYGEISNADAKALLAHIREIERILDIAIAAQKKDRF